MQFITNPLAQFIVDIRDYGIEYVVKRYYSLYGGEVVTCNDEQGQARCQVKVSPTGVGVVAQDGSFRPATIEHPALPSSIYAGQDHGIYFPPEEGDAVWVSFDHGDVDHPRTHGSWWRNTDPNLSKSGSEVPTEFQMDGMPKRRGIKTAYGHGMIYSDEDSMPYVALWSGKQLGVGEDAKRKQQITLSDAAGIKTVNDETVNAGIYAHTTEGYRVKLDDTEKRITVSGKPDDPGAISDNSFVIDEKLDQITIKTKGPVAGRNEVILDKNTQTITVRTAGQQSIILDDKTGLVTITATGALVVNAAGGIATGSGAAPPLPSVPGAAIETGVGTKLIDFKGAITENVLSMVQNVTGLFAQSALTIAQTATTAVTISAPTISLLGGAIVIGAPGTRVVNEQLIDWLANHTHATAAPGPPSKPTEAPLIQDPGTGQPIPAFVTTTQIL